REENIARYGWDTAVLDLLGQLYSERTHFIFELIQNAEDAGATELAFGLFADRLELRHDGRPFTEADVRGVCGVGQGSKAADLTAIGQFGIGFKAVYAYTRSPQVHSGGEHFRIENFVRPFAAEPVPADGTLFVFPFDHDTVPATVAAAEIGEALTALEPRVLLFLRSIERLRLDGTGVPSTIVERSVAFGKAEAGGSTEDGGGGGRRHVTLTGGRGRREEWLVWQRRPEGLGAAAGLGQAGGQGQAGGLGQAEGLGQLAPPVEIAFRSEGGRLVPCDSSPLVVFFPTEKETFLGFLAQGPYRTTPARDNVPGQDPANQVLVAETAALLGDVLRELRDEELLTAEVLQALPLDAVRFAAGTMFAPLFDAVADLLSAEPLVPVAGGGYGVATELELADRPEVRELLTPGQLGTLLGAGRPVRFTGESISERGTPTLWHYLRDEIGLDEITPDEVLARVSGDFLAAQADEWMVRFYAFLFTDSALWEPARAMPVIRLEDGRQVVPADDQGRPVVYLPGAAPSRMPTVRRAVAAAPAARPFLAALNLAEPDVVAEALQFVLPRYDDPDLAPPGLAGFDLARHDADLDVVVRALDEAGAGPREELLERLARTAFLIGENAATGEQCLRPPPRLYQRSKELEVYFEANPDAWFAGDRYGPWLSQLRGMGVRPDVEVHARTPNQLGYVMITLEFGRNERGLGGFDPGAEIDGLRFALEHPGYARSEYVWNVLLGPNRRLIAGVVEHSVLPSFSDVSAENARSAIAAVADGQAWLPGRDGTFRRPGEVSLDDLPATFARDEGLAQALGMLAPVVGLAAERLGVPAEVLWGLSAHPDLVALVERELADRAGSDAGRDQGER
ncbi:MAG TPA: hypothetical protein VGI96_35510, partial [Streptosporangiaceae bacterium]